MAVFWIGLLVLGLLATYVSTEQLWTIAAPETPWAQGLKGRPSTQFQVIDITQDAEHKCDIRTNFNMGPDVCHRRNYFVAHGWFESVNVIAYHMLMEKLKTCKVNVFFVDWKDIAGNAMYHRISVAFVGTCLAKYLKENVYKKCRNPYVHLIGHSLGAHVMGNAGRSLQRWNVRADVITALDAAGPGFYFFKKKMRLSPSDAKHVVQLVTNKLFYGTTLKFGHVVFYANGGMFQPGCPSDHDITTSPAFCSHQRSVSYTIEAIISDKFIARRCGRNDGDSGPDSLVYNLNVPTHARGTYCFKTSHKPPYGLGHEGY